MRRLLSLFLAGMLPVAASASAAAPRAGTVLAVEAGSVADLVVLDAGFDGGLRQGMLCRLVREIGEVILVALRPAVSAALITRLAGDQAVRPGDVALLKLLKS
jgi:hypothetical protein